MRSAKPGGQCLYFCAEEIERCRETVRTKLERRQVQVSDLNDVQALLIKLERSALLTAATRRSYFKACGHCDQGSCAAAQLPVGHSIARHVDAVLHTTAEYNVYARFPLPFVQRLPVATAAASGN